MGNVFGQLFFFFALARLARVLGPSEFGTWNFAQVFMLYLFRASEFGLETVGIRETSRDPKTFSRWIATVVSVRFLSGLLLFGLASAAASAGLFPPGTATLVIISSLCLFPMAFIVEWVFESCQEVGLISVARILKGVLFFVAVFFLVSTSQDVEMAAYLYVASLALPTFIVAAVVVHRFGFDRSSLNVKTWFAALKTAGPIGTASMLSQYSLFASTMVVGYFLTREDLGYFSAANRIVIFLWAYVLLSMHRILLPNLSKVFRESLSDYRRYVAKIFRLSALAAVPVGVIGTLWAGPLMNVLYTSRYAASGVVFGILLWGFVLANIRTILEIALIASDRQRRYMKGMILLAVLYTILTPALTIKFGISGTAVAVVVSEAGYFLFLLLTSPFSDPATLMQSSWRPLTAAVAAIGVVQILSGASPVVEGVLGVAVFFLVLVVLRGVTPDDLKVVRSLVRRDHLETPA